MHHNVTPLRQVAYFKTVRLSLPCSRNKNTRLCLCQQRSRTPPPPGSCIRGQSLQYAVTTCNTNMHDLHIPRSSTHSKAIKWVSTARYISFNQMGKIPWTASRHAFWNKADCGLHSQYKTILKDTLICSSTTKIADDVCAKPIHGTKVFGLTYPDPLPWQSPLKAIRAKWCVLSYGYTNVRIILPHQERPSENNKEKRNTVNAPAGIRTWHPTNVSEEAPPSQPTRLKHAVPARSTKQLQRGTRRLQSDGCELASHTLNVTLRGG